MRKLCAIISRPCHIYGTAVMLYDLVADGENVACNMCHIFTTLHKTCSQKPKHPYSCFWFSSHCWRNRMGAVQKSNFYSWKNASRLHASRLLPLRLGGSSKKKTVCQGHQVVLPAWTIMESCVPNALPSGKPGRLKLRNVETCRM